LIVHPTSEFDALDKMKATQLKILCKERGLKVAGKKTELKERLKEHFVASAQPAPPAESQTDDLEAMPDEDLRDALIVRNKSGAGTREEILQRLKNDIEYTSELIHAISPDDRDGYIALSEALEHAAKNEGGAITEYLNELKQKSQEVPKHIALTVTSLNLEPEKFTAGGAPSVTADVLRKLAGDPFGDPPTYGTVSYSGIGVHRIYLDV
jgi:gas vesicle protein